MPIARTALGTAALAVTLASPALAQGTGAISFNGAICTTNLTDHPWVIDPWGNQSYMWGTISTWAGQATGSLGFASLAGIDHSLLRYELANYGLDEWQSPGPNTPGYEIYRPQGNAAIYIYYDNVHAVTLGLSYLRTDVEHVYDLNATGYGEVELIGGFSPIGTALFFEIMEITHGRGKGHFNISDFYPVDGGPLKGNFGSLGTLQFAPPAVIEDLNDDGAVDGGDLALLLSAWGDCTLCPSDINQDGTVDGADLTLLLVAWG